MRVDEAVLELKQIRHVYANMRKEYKSCVEALDTAIKAMKTQKWTPCSEGLPKKRDLYWGMFRESNTGWVNPIPYICDYLGYRSMSTTKDGWILLRLTDDIDGQVNKYFSEMLECVAWMRGSDVFAALPEPYKEVAINDKR